MQTLYSPVELAVLNSLEAIDVLFDSRQRSAFLPFLHREISVSQAALEVGELPNTMLYRVKRWQRLGLLLETQSVPVAKGSMRLYGSTAQAYFVPYTATSAEDLVALANNVYTPIFTDFLRAYVQAGENLSRDWGVLFTVQEKQWSVRPVKSAEDFCLPADATSPPTMLEYTQVQLSSAEAKAMQLELLAVAAKYARRSNRKGKLYKVLLGMS